MSEGKSRENWQHTSAILCLIANVNRDPKKSRPYRPSDFNPYESRKYSDAVVVTKDNIDVLRNAFTGGKGVNEK